MSDFETESRLLSAEAELSGPPARTVETVTLEIRTLQRQAQQIVLGYAIEIGRRLEEVKEMLPHGRWGEYLKNEVEYSQSTAQNFMRIYREYGASQQSLFGGQANSQALGNLTYTKALQLLALPDAEERERFVAEHDVENMSTRELSEALKARDAALAEAAEAKAEVQAAKDAQEKAAAKAQRLQDALSEANASAQTAAEEHARLLQELEELRSRPVDVAVEVDTGAVEAARKAAIEEMTGKIDAAKDASKQAEEKREAAEKALAAAQRELDELKAKKPEVRELTQEEKDALTAEAVNQAKAEGTQRVRELEKQLAQADPDTAEFKAMFNAWQKAYQDMMDCLEKISGRDPEKVGRFRNAVKASAEGMVAG